MADPQAAQLTQLRNIQAKTGRTIAALHAELGATGLAKVSEKRTWLMTTGGMAEAGVRRGGVTRVTSPS